MNLPVPAAALQQITALRPGCRRVRVVPAA